jgi:hypothetical protein
MRRTRSLGQSPENDWAEKLKKEAESWRSRKTVPTLARNGVQIVRVPKRRRGSDSPQRAAR